MWKFLAILLGCGNFCFASEINDVLPNAYPDVYNVEVLPFKEHGWYANAQFMSSLIHRYGIKNVVEVGSWLGTSTRHIAKLIPEDGIVFAIDHWDGSEEHHLREEFKALLPMLFQQFLSNVIHENLTHKIIPVRMDSLSAAEKLKQLNLQIDLVYLDADHATDALYADLNAWYPYVQQEGIICGDDWCWDTVKKAVYQFAKENNLKVQGYQNFWLLTKKQNKRVFKN